MQQSIETRISDFCDRLGTMYAAHYVERSYVMQPPTFYAEYGRKNVRIVERDGETGKPRCVYCFIDRENGDILKASGWKAPAKGKRGSIWNDDCDVGLNKPANLYGSGLYK